MLSVTTEDAYEFEVNDNNDDDDDMLVEPPDNDVCTSATPLLVPLYAEEETATGSHLGATLADTAQVYGDRPRVDDWCGLTDFFKGGENATTDVWYSMEGTGSGIAVSLNATYELFVSVYNGSCDDLTCVLGKRASSEAQWASEEGEMYYVKVSDIYKKAVGDFQLTVRGGDIPDNGQCSSATMIELKSITNATTDFGSGPWLEGCEP